MIEDIIGRYDRLPMIVRIMKRRAYPTVFCTISFPGLGGVYIADLQPQCAPNQATTTGAFHQASIIPYERTVHNRDMV